MTLPAVMQAPSGTIPALVRYTGQRHNPLHEYIQGLGPIGSRPFLILELPMTASVHTVADLIAELQKLPPSSVPMSSEPPFDGVQVIPQTTGHVFIAPLPRDGGHAVLGPSQGN